MLSPQQIGDCKAAVLGLQLPRTAFSSSAAACSTTHGSGVALWRHQSSFKLSSSADSHHLSRRILTVMAMETSAASSVPQELFDLILDFHQVDEGHHTQHDHDLRNYATVEKHDLGQLSLVCRHWGQICQRKIFETIRLGSWADVHELQALLDAPASRISRYILHLEISAQDGPGEPWLHLIAFLWPRLYAIEQYVGLTLSLKNTRPTRCSSMRSIHAALPRSQPVFSSRITHLTLTDISFRQIADLMHLVGEMSDLVDVDCIRLTWGVPERLPQRQMGRGYSNLTVRMSDCTSLWPAIWISAGVTQRSRCNLLPEDLVCMGHLAKAIETGVDRKKWPQPSSFAISHSRDINAVPFASRKSGFSDTSFVLWLTTVVRF